MNVVENLNKKIQEAERAQAKAAQEVKDLKKQKEEYIKADNQKNAITDIAIGIAEKILSLYSDNWDDYLDTTSRSSSYRPDETERDMKLRVLRAEHQIDIDTEKKMIILDSWWADSISDVFNLAIKIESYES